MELKFELSPEQWEFLQRMDKKLDLLLKKGEKETYSVSEVVSMTGLGDQTVRNYVEKGIFEFKQDGPKAKILIIASSVHTWLEKRESKTNS